MKDWQHATVSAIIPVFNGRNRVGQAIESALAQTHVLKEVIVVDDGSTDDTAEVVRQYPVQYVHQLNAGPGAARDTGARLAGGEWFAFLDHDDTWRPDKTERQIQFGLDPLVGVVYCALKKIDQAPMNWEHLWGRNIVGTPSSVLVRRQCYFDAGGFDRRRSLIGVEDHHLWLRVALTDWRLVRCPTPLFTYAPTDQSLSNQYLKMMRAEWTNCEDIGPRAGLSEKIIQKKKIDIANHYIREFIGKRNMEEARAVISEIGGRNVPLELLLGAFSPNWVLKVRKSIRARTVGVCEDGLLS